MRAIRQAMETRSFAAIPDLMRAMIRLWTGTAIETGMRRRRTDEARLFEAGLAAMALSGLVLQPAEASSLAAADVAPAAAQEPSEDELGEDPTEEDVAAQTFAGIEQAASPISVFWAADPIQPDYSHLETNMPKGGSFALTADDLALLAKLNDFTDALGPDDTPVLFGLRGAGIVKDHSNPAGVVLKDQRPDHHVQRCVIGTWDRRNGNITVFPASTVPNAGAVVNYKIYCQPAPIISSADSTRPILAISF